MMRIVLAALACLIGTSAVAELRVTFTEGAPKDSFTFRNTSACAIDGGAIRLDLAGSAGRLVFDTEAGGTGVEVFQPLEIVAGAEYLARPAELRDGDTSVTLDIATLPAGGVIAFTIDVDDTLGAREITVTGSENAGARVSLGAVFATFGRDAAARLATPRCPG